MKVLKARPNNLDLILQVTEVCHTLEKRNEKMQ